MASPQLASAQRGTYEILRRLGKGGMAEIYLARVVGLEGFEKLVVLKRLPVRALAKRDLLAMFLHEARLAALLEHQNVVQVFDVGTLDGTYFFAMEFVHGQDARRILKAARTRAVPIPLEIAVSIGRDVSAGLHYAHEKVGLDGQPLGIIHRDVTPSNVLLSYEGMVKLTDFGIAKTLGQQHETEQGTVRGKLAYMSPEQCSSKPLDRRSDIFSLGVVLWELTTGQKLYTGGSEYEIMHCIVHEPAPSPTTARPGYPQELARIVMRALERDRTRRYPTAQQLQTDLEAFAVRAQLGLSTVRIARFMETLFADDIAAWKEARAAGQGLLEFLSGDEAERRRAELDGGVGTFSPITETLPTGEELGALIGEPGDGAELEAMVPRPTEPTTAWLPRARRRGPEAPAAGGPCGTELETETETLEPGLLAGPAPPRPASAPAAAPVVTAAPARPARTAAPVVTAAPARRRPWALIAVATAAGLGALTALGAWLALAPGAPAPGGAPAPAALRPSSAPAAPVTPVAPATTWQPGPAAASRPDPAAGASAPALAPLPAAREPGRRGVKPPRRVLKRPAPARSPKWDPNSPIPP